MNYLERKKQIVRGIEYLSFLFIIYLYITKEQTSNTLLVGILASFIGIYWWEKIETITNNPWILKRKLDIEGFLGTMPIIIGIQWHVLDSKLMFFAPSQAITYGIAWSVFHIALAFFYYHHLLDDPQVKNEMKRAKIREELAKKSIYNDHVKEMIRSIE